ncbi:MAG: cytochrome C oxidase subunit IV family protein [Chloroflexota bacterium]
MAEENKPEETTEETGQPTGEQIEDLAHTAPAPAEYPEGQAEEMAEHMPVEPNVVEKTVIQAMEETEELSDSAPSQAFDSAVSAVQEGIESIPGAPEHKEEAVMNVDLHGETTVLMGRTLPYPIYTVVFFALGILTLAEVLLAEIFNALDLEIVKVPVLLGIATAKALLVVIFYMHLNTDSRVFALSLAVPVGIALLSTLFLVAIPHTGGY